jgi:hypothetical protein
VVEHHDERVSYRDSADRRTLVGFYTDCHHAVRYASFRADPAELDQIDWNAVASTDFEARPSRRPSKPSSSCMAPSHGISSRPGA